MQVESVTYRWEMREGADPETVAALSRDLNNLPVGLARALVLRGITGFEDARAFFRTNLEQLHDPFLMKDMDAAADRLVAAIHRGEKVLVYGDYDVDGVTSTVMMTSFLTSLGVETRFFIPNRQTHGYGLHVAGLEFAASTGCTLVVALDCGITAVEPALAARKLGLDLIICDHHTVGDAIPDAVAVLDPKRPDCSYPYPHLSGCGVGFKLAEAALLLLGRDRSELHPLLDLVAISIASDIVPVTGENRILFRAGLDVLRSDSRIGTRALASGARLDIRTCSPSQIVFGIAPRINAAGRLAEAADAARLLLAADAAVARDLAKQIETTNATRKKIDADTELQAVEMASRIRSERSADAYVLYDASWHPGVIGITASRVVERFFRPTIMLTDVDGTVKGSARSIHGVNVYEAISKCRDVLIQFGGHDFAAGVQLERSQVDAFRRRFEEAVSEQLTPELRRPAIRIDAEVSLEEIDERFWAVLKQFEPFGPSNSRPVFVSHGLEVVQPPRVLGKRGEHLKFKVRQSGTARGIVRDVIGFDMGDRQDFVSGLFSSGATLSMAYTVDENEWKNTKTLQLRPRDMRADGASMAVAEVSASDRSSG
ncbi:MAG: single-stranded-DNA-specific exonuclease RecJ [Bacteroidetes bacterium]|nr:single-stranded-DNA-specific exonuclease RecJ [Bacteroidota bacterium]